MLFATDNSHGGRSGRGVGMKSQHAVTDANRRGREGKKRPYDLKVIDFPHAIPFYHKKTVFT